VQRLSWRIATVADLRDETPHARTIGLDVPGWPGHLAGQHLDVRLTAPDGYTATRSYSIASAAASAAASAPGNVTRIELTVERLDDGEVSPYLAGELRVGDALEVLGPVGGWFVWRPGGTGPVQLLAGGSGVVPLMAMVRSHAQAGAQTPMRLLYSAREPASVFYADELGRLTSGGSPREVAFWYTRQGPQGAAPAGRLDAAAVADLTWPASAAPTCYVCGSNGFVETVAGHLVAAGHDPRQVRTERFGPTGGTA
jgi:ferredoxin-NADP reductase